MSDKPNLDWVALQRALVFTNLDYRRPVTGVTVTAAVRDRQPIRADVPVPETVAADVPAGEPAAVAAVAASEEITRGVRTSHVSRSEWRDDATLEALAEEVDGLLPWPCDE